MAHTQKQTGIDIRDFDTSVRPQDDFYHYAAGGWLKRNPIPKPETRWGSFTKLRKETDDILHGILTRVAAKRGALSEREQQLKNFFRSGMDMKTRNKRGLAPIIPWLKMIEAIQSKEDLTRTIARLERVGIGGPWGMVVDMDSKDSTRYIVHIHQSGLSLPDRDYYLKDDAESTRVRIAYEAYLQKRKQPVSLIMCIEKTIAEASMIKEDLRDAEKTYHKLTGASLAKLAPEIDWKLYFKEIGTEFPRTLIVMQPEFLRTMNRLYTEVTLEDWRLYLSWHVLNGASGYLTRKLEKESFAFYGTVLTGATHMKPLWRPVLGAVNGHLGELLGEIYVKDHFSPEARRKMNHLVADLFAAYKERIKKLDWMNPATKRKALVKLSQMNQKIGYPSKWKSYKGLLIKPDDYAGNALRSNEYELRRVLKKLNKPIDKTEWHMYPQTVNAYCNFNMNEIVFPAAILQPPFFNLTADDAVNYGSIGTVIGHEITHGFDDQGAKFDGNGNMKSWWTKDDQGRFTKKAKGLVAQYDLYRVADNVPVNGQLTLGENIADLGGISIAYDAYQKHLERSGRENVAGFTSEQRYFIGVSLFERENARPAFEKMKAITDPHSPAKFRVNGPLSNLPEFYEAFDVKPGDKLYRSPKDRVRIW